MYVFDRRILSVLRDGQAKYFEQILSDVTLSPNTLRQHLDKLMDKGIIEMRLWFVIPPSIPETPSMSKEM